jgi:hypothetical protein
MMRLVIRLNDVIARRSQPGTDENVAVEFLEFWKIAVKPREQIATMPSSESV